METFNITPIPSLSNVIKNIWIVDGGNAKSLEKMIPFGCMDLVYVENSTILYKGAEMVRLWKNDIFLTGQVTQSYDFEYAANAKIIGFGFYPHQAHLFTKTPSHHFTDKLCKVGDLFSSTTILERLGNTIPISEKINLLQYFILEKIQANKPNLRKQEYLQYVLSEILNKKGHLDLRGCYKKLNISQRYIQALFKEYVGVSPGLYAKIIRFVNAIDHNHKNKKDLTALALSLGYYDQSHFIRDFKRFTGLTPKGYFKEPPYLLEQFTTNEASSLLYNSIPSF